MDLRAKEERVVGYAAERRRGWCWTAVAAFVGLVVSVVPFGMEWVVAWLRVWEPWMRTWQEMLMFFGALVAVVVGFRAMVVLEKEEHAGLRGRWMGAVGFYGGLVWVVVAFWKSVR